MILGFSVQTVIFIFFWLIAGIGKQLKYTPLSRSYLLLQFVEKVRAGVVNPGWGAGGTLDASNLLLLKWWAVSFFYDNKVKVIKLKLSSAFHWSSWFLYLLLYVEELEHRKGHRFHDAEMEQQNGNNNVCLSGLHAGLFELQVYAVPITYYTKIFTCFTSTWPSHFGSDIDLLYEASILQIYLFIYFPLDSRLDLAPIELKYTGCYITCFFGCQTLERVSGWPQDIWAQIAGNCCLELGIYPETSKLQLLLVYVIFLN
jgi:hypothetical protein